MTTVLILTTGGSPEPLVKSISQIKPDYTIFICSKDQPGPPREMGSYIMVDGPGKPCKIRGGKEKGGEDRESIVVQTGLGAEHEAYEKVITSNPDNLAHCYNASLDAIHKALNLFPGARICADYTGGTKTMSSALSMAAIDHGGFELFVVSGPRKDLIKVASGTEMLRHVDWTPILWTKRRRVLDDLFTVHDYNGCIELIDELAYRMPIGSEQERQLHGYLAICRGFQVWDEFRHSEALEYLEPYGAVMSRELTFLRSIIRSREAYNVQTKAAVGEVDGCAEGVKPNLALVCDILRNAERRLNCGQFDDAVGRIYRALELMAQYVLLYIHPPVFTSDVRLESLPDNLKGKYIEIRKQQANNGKDRLELPLFKAYELLDELNHPLGSLFSERKEEMRNLLQVRNHSIFAHGLDPVPEDKAREFYLFVTSLLEACEKEMKLPGKYESQPQFPKKLPVL